MSTCLVKNNKMSLPRFTEPDRIFQFRPYCTVPMLNRDGSAVKNSLDPQTIRKSPEPDQNDMVHP